MNITNKMLAILIWFIVVIMLATKTDSFGGGLFFIPFVMWPHLISHIMIYRRKILFSQLILMIAQVGYFIWFCYVYNDIFYKNLDPQSSIGLIFVGFYAAKILIFFWLIAWQISGKKPIVE